MDPSTELIGRREFIRRMLMSGIFVITGLSTGEIQGRELIYQLEKASFKAKPEPSTVFLARLIDKESDMWQVGGGVLVGPKTILTASHILPSPDFIYSLGPDYARDFQNHQAVTKNIVEATNHPAIDLSVVSLKKEADVDWSKIRQEPLRVGDGPLSLAAVSSLQRKEIYAGYVGELSGRDQFGRVYGKETMFVCNNSAASPGTSGGPVFLESTGELVGVVSGGTASSIGKLNPRSYYVNLTAPEVHSWVRNQMKTVGTA